MTDHRRTHRSVSIAQARAALPDLVKDAETGTPVEITRRGKPVAVLVSATTYQRLSAERPTFTQALGRFLATADRIGPPLEGDGFEGLRDPTPGRDVHL